VGQRPRALEAVVVTPGFWRGRRVFVTGHTGFKGSWLSLLLTRLGARVSGFALAPDTSPSLYEQAEVGSVVDSVIGDIRDAASLRSAMQRARPEIVLHLAAQALVRHSYGDPVGTYETNVMGTVHTLEAIRATPSVRAAVVVTTDKCYENNDGGTPFREQDPLGGHDPYSSSKACAELLCAAWRQSFLAAPDAAHAVGLATARAGNVIGGGDWAVDRLVPDLLAAIAAGRALALRNPHATRPWQHVLEPLAGYLMLAERLHEDPQRWAGAWNFGPAEQDICDVQHVVTILSRLMGRPLALSGAPGRQPHEAQRLALNSTKAHHELGWSPRWKLEEALAAIAEWQSAAASRTSARDITLRQIDRYLAQPAAVAPATRSTLRRRAGQPERTVT
jgi:CDP-glucose 4,6-dehydratase